MIPKGKPERKILIVGCGLSGVCAALFLKRVSDRKGLNLNVQVFETGDLEEKLLESGESHIVYKWAVDVLVEAGLSSRLSQVMSPITRFEMFDSETSQLLSEYPRVNNNPPCESTMEMGNANSNIPFMYSARECDLKRVLLLALSGLINQEQCVRPLSKQEANNADATFDCIKGIEADLARGSWFKDQNLIQNLPQINLHHELESFIISASTGKVSAQFTNGRVEECDMLIGADGIHSKVRRLILNDRCPAQHAGAAVFSGVTRIHLPPADMPTELENGILIPDVSREDLLQYCSEGKSVSWSGKGYSFNTVNLGNGMMSWNLIVPQSEPGDRVRNFLLSKKREQISRVLSKNPRRSILSINDLSPLREALDDSANDSASTDNSLSESPSSLQGKSLEPSAGYRIVETNTNQSQHEDSTLVKGKKLRDLVLALCQNLQLPHVALAILARSEPDWLQHSDSFDVAQEQPESYTSADFHPGRVVVIGDAAHPICLNAYGSFSASLAITDAAYLAKLVGKYLDPMTVDDDEHAFTCISFDYVQDRLAKCNAIVKDARFGGGWEKAESSWARSILRIGMKYAPTSWTSPFESMISRGAVPNEENLPTLHPI